MKSPGRIADTGTARNQETSRLAAWALRASRKRVRKSERPSSSLFAAGPFLCRAALSSMFISTGVDPLVQVLFILRRSVFSCPSLPPGFSKLILLPLERVL